MQKVEILPPADVQVKISAKGPICPDLELPYSLQKCLNHSKLNHFTLQSQHSESRKGRPRALSSAWGTGHWIPGNTESGSGALMGHLVSKDKVWAGI